MSERRMRFPVYARISAVAARKQFVSLALVVMVALLASAPAAWGYLCAWGEIYVLDGQAAGDVLGCSVSGAGDVDNDGYDDVIVGAKWNDAGGTHAGRAYVYSGQTGDVIWTFTGEADNDQFGYSVSGAGDVNNDGYDDLIVGAVYNSTAGYHYGRAYVYSGLTGALLWTITGEGASDVLGNSVSGAGDVNNDGYDDFIVGASGSDAGGTDAGRAYVYSGLTGGLLWTLTGEAAGDRLGQSVSGAGDVNDDGYDDFVVGASENDAGGTSAGRAYVYSGLTGTALWTFTGEAAGDDFGASVSGAGDVNDDGHADLIVGAYQYDGGGSNRGRAYVYSGQTGSLLWTFSGILSGDHFGHSVSGAGDVNEDGYDDLIVGARNAGGDVGRAYIYSGQTGSLLHAFTGEATDDEFGCSVSGAGDVNNDGIPDVIVGADRHDGTAGDAGRAYVFSGVTEVFCYTGQAANDFLGYSVSWVGDIDKDGYDDVIVGVPADDQWGVDAGYMYVYSGRTGNFIRSGSSTFAGDNFGLSVSGMGDLDNDTYPDYMVGAPGRDYGGDNAGAAYVYSGYNSSILCTFYGDAPGEWVGYSVSGAGDMNNDGYDDAIIGAPRADQYATDGGEALVHSGPDCWWISTWYLTGEEDDHTGHSVSGAGDMNNDGYDELLIGVPGADHAATDAGMVWCCAGYTVEVFWSETGESAYDEFGFSVSEAGDVNNDGFDDWIVGAPYNDAAGPNSGRAYVYSGPNGDLLYSFPGEAAQDYFGYSVAGAGDVNGDGYDDLIVGAPYNDAGSFDVGRAYVFCGRTGALLCLFSGEEVWEGFGHSVSGAGDVDNDGLDEVIVGAPYNSAGGTEAGRAYVFGCEAFATSICGDANGDDIVNIGDIVYLVSYLYKSGPAPAPECVGDVNQDDIINVGDVVYLVSYLYKGGPSPSPYCCMELLESCQGLADRRAAEQPGNTANPGESGLRAPTRLPFFD